MLADDELPPPLDELGTSDCSRDDELLLELLTSNSADLSSVFFFSGEPLLLLDPAGASTSFDCSFSLPLLFFL